MIFWKLWVIALVITIITKITVCLIKKSVTKNNDLIKKAIIFPPKIKIPLQIVCIIFVGGIPVANIFAAYYENLSVIEILLLGIPVVMLAYMFVVGILLGYFDIDVKLRVCFVLVLIISIIGWTILINNYNRRNIEDVTETSIERTVERKLLYFCNIPVQEITGEVSGNSSIFGGSVSGSIDTTHELTYWYVNENGRGLFDTAPSDSSEIEFIENGETPYVEILNYYQCTKRIDHYTDSETIYGENRWTQYVFHLPQTIMQYSLD